MKRGEATHEAILGAKTKKKGKKFRKVKIWIEDLGRETPEGEETEIKGTKQISGLLTTEGGSLERNGLVARAQIMGDTLFRISLSIEQKREA